MIKTDSIVLTRAGMIAILFSSFVGSVCLILLDGDKTVLPFNTYIKEFVFCSILYTCVLSVPIYGSVMFYKSIVRDLKYELTVLKKSKKAE